MDDACPGQDASNGGSRRRNTTGGRTHCHGTNRPSSARTSSNPSSSPARRVKSALAMGPVPTRSCNSSNYSLSTTASALPPSSDSIGAPGMPRPSGRRSRGSAAHSSATTPVSVGAPMSPPRAKGFPRTRSMTGSPKELRKLTSQFRAKTRDSSSAQMIGQQCCSVEQLRPLCELGVSSKQINRLCERLEPLCEQFHTDRQRDSSGWACSGAASPTEVSDSTRSCGQSAVEDLEVMARRRPTTAPTTSPLLAAVPQGLPSSSPTSSAPTDLLLTLSAGQWGSQ